MRRHPNFEILKEPRGFIKILEIGIAIFAFSTTAGYYSEFTVNSSYTLTNSTTCPKPHDPLFKILSKFEYPFDDDQYYISSSDNCKLNISDTDKYTTSIKGNYKSESQFFVFTGVLTFLYCLVALVDYIMFEDQEQSMYATDVGKFSFVVIDFVMSVILAVFWFISSVAWAAGLSGFKHDTDPARYLESAKLCSADEHLHCKVTTEPNYATLKVSIILGFLNLFVWLGNLWFVFKETPWHNPRQNVLHEDSVQ